ncbi:MAG: tetratricopeptide repeat protein [Terricaulis sp.]
MRTFILALAALVCSSATAHAELKVVVSPDGDHRLALANAPDDLQAELVGFAEGDIPMFDQVDCATIGARLLPQAREDLSIETIVARYNLINVWTGNLCPGTPIQGLQGEETRDWLIEIAGLRRAEDGAPFLEAQDRLLEMYIFGAPGVEPDPVAAREYLAGEAARAHLAGDAAGDPRTSLHIAYMRQHGIGEPADEAGTIPLLRRAALAGSAEARALLAQASELGLGMPRDEAAAFAQYTELARGVWPTVWYRLGLMLRDGRGVAADPCAARRWLERAATHSWSPVPAMREALASIAAENCPR